MGRAGSHVSPPSVVRANQTGPVLADVLDCCGEPVPDGVDEAASSRIGGDRLLVVDDVGVGARRSAPGRLQVRPRSSERLTERSPGRACWRRRKGDLPGGAVGADADPGVGGALVVPPLQSVNAATLLSRCGRCRAWSRSPTTFGASVRPAVLLPGADQVAAVHGIDGDGGLHLEFRVTVLRPAVSPQRPARASRSGDGDRRPADAGRRPGSEPAGTEGEQDVAGAAHRATVSRW